MRDVKLSTAFRRDLKRERAGQRGRDIDPLLDEVVPLLAADQPLPPEYCDHPLKGAWGGYRDCHLKPDLILIYGKPDPDILYLARLGSHSELFG